jgi:hypothetical protein
MQHGSLKESVSLLYLIEPLHCTLFHGFDTLGSHLREEGSLDYDGDFSACKSKWTLIQLLTVNNLTYQKHLTILHDESPSQIYNNTLHIPPHMYEQEEHLRIAKFTKYKQHNYQPITLIKSYSLQSSPQSPEQHSSPLEPAAAITPKGPVPPCRWCRALRSHPGRPCSRSRTKAWPSTIVVLASCRRASASSTPAGRPGS